MPKKAGTGESAKDAEALEKLQRELDELAAEIEAPELTLPPETMAQLLSQQYAAMVSEYWRDQIRGKVATITGDNPTAKAHFKAAKAGLERIAALNDVVAEHGPAVADKFGELISAWREQAAKENREATQAAVLKAANAG